MFFCASPSHRWVRAAQTVIRESADQLGVDPWLDCLVAVSEDKLVGVILFRPVDPDGYGRVRSLGVIPTRRREGIGLDLKTRAVALMVAAGARLVESEVHCRNFPMQGLNDKLAIRSEPDPDDSEYRLYAARIGFDDGPGNNAQP